MVWGTQAFGGMRPVVPEHLLKDHQAAYSRDAWNTGGALMPIPARAVTSVSVPNSTRTLYRFTPNQWFAWPDDVDVVRAPVPNDTVRRTLWTGDERSGEAWPKMTTTVILGSFTQPGIPTGFRRLGIPTPENAPTLASDDLPGSTAVATIDDIPSTPMVGDYIRFTAPVTGLTGFVDIDGSTAVTAAAFGDWFVRQANNWRKLADPPDVPSTAVATIDDIPSTPMVGDYIRFTAPVTGLTGFVDIDGSTAVTAAAIGDWFVRQANNWRKLADPPDAPSTAVATIDDIPSTPMVGDYIRFTAQVAGLMGFIGIDGSTAVTAAAFGDWFVRQANNWRKLADPPEAAADPDAVDVFHSWVYTFVSDLGEEGPPSTPSDVQEREFANNGDIQAVTVTTDTAITGPYVLTHKRIYRTFTGATGVTTFQLVAEVPMATAAYTDDMIDTALGDALLSTSWDMPPEDLKGIIALPNGVCAGFDGRDVYFSVPYQPHAWPEDYRQTVDADIVGLGAFGTTVIILTVGNPYLAAGTHPENYALARQELDQPCVSKGSIASVGVQGVVYAAPDGLVLIGPGGGKFVSEDAYDLAKWRGLGMENAVGIYHDQRFVAFLATRAIAFDVNSGEAYEFDVDADAVFVDRTADRLYLALNGTVEEFRTVPETAVSNRTALWRSKTWRMQLQAPSAAQVFADGPVTLRLYGDGALRATLTIPDVTPVWLLKPGLAREWYAEIETQHRVTEFLVGEHSEMYG